MICGSDHTASAWNAKIGVPRQAPKSLRPSDKLTPNPRSGSEGDVYGGDRLPWIAADDVDNYVPLNAMTWQVHVYGIADAELKTWCEAHQLPVHVFPWRSKYGTVGLAQDALYLIRPDTYVALAIRPGTADSLQLYFTKRGIRIGSRGGTHKHAA
jgi:hypothetical protein